MAKVERSCPVCQHPHAESVYENVMAAINGCDMSYTVGRCQNCGLFFANRLADDQVFQNYYQSVSKYDIAVGISEFDRLRIDAAVNMCQGRIAHEAMVVDLGCSCGALLSGFRNAGWTHLYGVDPAPNAAERAHQLFGLQNIYHGAITEAHSLLPLAKADLICMTAVLEHLPYLHDDLSGLLEKLQPGCRILVEVPALERFSGFHSEPFGEFSLEHIQFFSTISLVNLFGLLGAQLLALQIVDLSAGCSGSLFGLFELSGASSIAFTVTLKNSDVMFKYISDSQQQLDKALSRIPASPLVIYGAGSHTARLLPYLEKITGLAIVAVVDNNPNLLNKTIGNYTIQSPSIIKLMSDYPILISSFRFQNEIAARLRDQYPNSLILLYE